MTLVNPLMSTIVLPYLGPAAAAKELTRKPPECAEATPAPQRDPVKALGMRLTYRTARTLSVIAEAPGRSNLELTALVGISDQGQMSKLLSRLARLGLIENTGAGSERGAANAWRITPGGRELETVINRLSSHRAR
jgi:DNA-binding MarR family transcriptional regulator